MVNNSAGMQDSLCHESCSVVAVSVVIFSIPSDGIYVPAFGTEHLSVQKDNVILAIRLYSYCEMPGQACHLQRYRRTEGINLKS